MFRLERFLHVAGHALLANNLRIFTNWTVLKSGISSFTLFFPFPDGRKIDLALRAAVRLLRWVWFLILRQIVNHVLEPQQVDELDIARIRHEVHLWRWRLRGRNLKECFLQLLAEGQFCRGLPLRLALWILSDRLFPVALQ